MSTSGVAVISMLLNKKSHHEEDQSSEVSMGLPTLAPGSVAQTCAQSVCSHQQKGRQTDDVLQTALRNAFLWDHRRRLLDLRHKLNFFHKRRAHDKRNGKIHDLLQSMLRKTEETLSCRWQRNGTVARRSQMQLHTCSNARAIGTRERKAEPVATD